MGGSEASPALLLDARLCFFRVALLISVSPTDRCASDLMAAFFTVCADLVPLTSTVLPFSISPRVLRGFAGSIRSTSLSDAASAHFRRADSTAATKSVLITTGFCQERDVSPESNAVGRHSACLCSLAVHGDLADLRRSTEASMSLYRSAPINPLTLDSMAQIRKAATPLCWCLAS